MWCQTAGRQFFLSLFYDIFYDTAREIFFGMSSYFLPEKSLKMPRLLFLSEDFSEKALRGLSVCFSDETGSSVPGTHPIEALSLSISGASSMAVLSAVIRS